MTEYYLVTITKSKIKINCQEHSCEAWKSFSNEEISKMDDNALEFWEKYKKLVLTAYETLFF